MDENILRRKTHPADVRASIRTCRCDQGVTGSPAGQSVSPRRRRRSSITFIGSRPGMTKYPVSTHSPSLMRPRTRICMTEAQWRELNARTRKGLDEMGQSGAGGTRSQWDPSNAPPGG